jgi:hypothetical protein
MYYTKKKKIYKKKTLKQKGGFERSILNSLTSINEQDNLACILRENSTLKFFAIDILYDVLKKIEEYTNKEDFKNLITNNIKQTMDSNNVITNIGFNLSEIEEIINAFNNKRDFLNLDILKKKIHSTTTCLTRLNNPYFQSLYIRNDSEILNEFLYKLKKIFNLPNTFTEEQFLHLYNDETKDNIPKKNAFDMLIVKILHTSNNVLGAIQLNYGREIFTRVDRPLGFTKTKETINNCFDDIIENDNNQIYGVKNFLDTNNTFVESIFNLYERRLIGGLSGSSYYLFFLITKILKYPYKKKNVLSKILCIAVMDYVPLWHSLEEILMTYSIEFEKFGFPKYTIDVEPIEYFKNIISISINPEEHKKYE